MTDLAPDYISPVVGYRSWGFKDGYLTSLNNSYWPYKEKAEADCTAGMWRGAGFKWYRHPAPAENCTCGIYAGLHINHLAGIGYLQETMIHGQLNMWGRIWEHQLGYRAEFAYPKNLCTNNILIGKTEDEIRLHIDQLSLYGVPVNFQIFKTRYNTEDYPVHHEILPLWTPEFGIEYASLHKLTEFRVNIYKNRRIIVQEGIQFGDRLMIGTTIGIVDKVTNWTVRARVGGNGRMNIEFSVNRQDVEWVPTNEMWQVTDRGARRIG